MQVQIGVITKLDEGYVLTIHGKNHVARNTKELGALVARLAGKRLQTPTAAEMPIPKENPPENVTPIRVDISWDEQRARDDKNLSRLIAARLGSQISEEDLMRGAERVVKTYSMEEVAKLVFAAEEQFFNAQQTVREKGLGAPCSCEGCPQNQSYPNERGQCVSCYRGEHLHPGGQHGQQGYSQGVPGRGDLAGRSSEPDEDDEAGNEWPPRDADSLPGAGRDGDAAGVRSTTAGVRDVPTFEQPEPAPGDDGWVPDDHDERSTAQGRH